jgi:alkylation response protein AidB-like acyl-CoA dehydrogenase
MASTVMSRADLDFLLFDWLQVDKLLARPRFAGHEQDTCVAFLRLAEEIATERFANHNRRADLNEPTLANGEVSLIPEVGQAWQAFADAGFIGAAFDAELGGLQLPRTVADAGMTWFQAANIATTAYPFLTIANAHLLAAHAERAEQLRWIPPMLEGRFSGTMCLSEPQAGSSLADIATQAVRYDDGSYRIFGSKMWISCGDHELTENIVHLVLARHPAGPPGSKGISLFLVPKFLLDDTGRPGERNDVMLGGLNHKMGYRGTSNAVLNFGEGGYRPGGEPGAVAYLIGAPNQGLAVMFHMMNEARIGVGLGAAALGYTGFLHSVEYAKVRAQGRISKQADSPPVPIIEHADVRRMLSAARAYVEGGIALGLYCSRLVDDIETHALAEERARAQLLLDVLTPVAKSWPSEWCLAANDLAIQVHGGYGYTRDYPVEQFYRDNRLNPIHEGTKGIQALDLVSRKLTLDGGQRPRILFAAMRDTVDTARAKRVAEGAALEAILDRLEHTTAILTPHGPTQWALDHATLYLDAIGHVVVGWIWLQLMTAVAGRDDDFAAAKRLTGAWYFRNELPKTSVLLDLLNSQDSSANPLPAAMFLS